MYQESEIMSKKATKKAVLATAATMTLCLSAVGPVFAAEEHFSDRLRGCFLN